ncbi:hypothetical protein [Halostella sp. PRR32]|uniref:hypothetical protein n=1 Tax=Halostella sp. PRR32 TaxID=3098147 RepID=UPI002B1D120F|nr:hypothetical protein [Halostella sp. PRR32]
MTVPFVPLHAGHGDPVPGTLLGVTFGSAVAVGLLAVLADRDAAADYVLGAVLSFTTAYVVVEASPDTHVLADASAVVAVALGVPAVHLAVAAWRSSARLAFLAVLYVGPVALVAYLLAPA